MEVILTYKDGREPTVVPVDSASVITVEGPGIGADGHQTKAHRWTQTFRVSELAGVVTRAVSE